jgi:molecular chaperone DnaK
MVKDAASHAAEDKVRRDLIDARNQADSLAYSVEKTVNENRDKLPVGDLSRVEGAISAVREAIKNENLDAIRRTTAELQTASHAIAEQLYKQQASGTGPHGSGQASGQHDDVKEGEVVDA